MGIILKGVDFYEVIFSMRSYSNLSYLLFFDEWEDNYY